MEKALTTSDIALSKAIVKKMNRIPHEITTSQNDLLPLEVELDKVKKIPLFNVKQGGVIKPLGSHLFLPQEMQNIGDTEKLVEELIHIDIEQELYLPRTGGIPAIHSYYIDYIIPNINVYILKLNTVNLKSLNNFYLCYKNLYIPRDGFRHKWSFYQGGVDLDSSIDYKFFIHPLLAAIKSNQRQFFLSVLNNKFSLFEIRECIIRLDYIPIDSMKPDDKQKYKEQVEPYIPTLLQFDQAVEEIKSLNKAVLGVAVDCLTRFKLVDELVREIVDFLNLDEIIFNAMDVSVLRALVIKQKINDPNTKHVVLLDTGPIRGVKGLLKHNELKKVQQQSIQDAEKQGVIGPREIIGFDLEDVEDDGNCFYYALANQMKIINHNFIQNVPVGTNPNNSLRLAMQGVNFRDRDWADDSTFDTLVIEFPDVILAVIDTRNPNAGFTCYYMDDDGVVITNTGEDPSLEMPQQGKMIIRIAATGNHFMSVRSHPEIDRGIITSAWAASTAGGLQASDYIAQTDIIIGAVFSIKYDNILLNHDKLPEILAIAKERAGAAAVIELMHLHTLETFDLSESNNAGEIVDQIIERNSFLNNQQGREFIQAIDDHFDREVLLNILELGRDQELAEQILIELDAQGINRVISTLLGKELPVPGITNNLENILGTEQLNQLRLVPNGILNSWSNKAYNKIADYIDQLAKNLDNLLNAGKSGNQVAVTLTLLEELLNFAASGQRFAGGMPPYYNPDDDNDWSYGGGGGGSSFGGSNNSSDNSNRFTGLILPLYNGTDFNVTDYQM